MTAGSSPTAVRDIPGWIECHLGRHAWEHQRNPEMGGKGADFEICRRCGKEKPVYGPPPVNGIGGGG